MIINPRAITVKADNKTSTYGDNQVLLTAQVTVGEIVDGDDLDTIYTLSCPVTNVSVVRDDYTITVNRGSNSNYDVTTINGTYVVTKRVVKFAIVDTSSTYGENRAALTANISSGEVVNNDGIIYTLNCDITKTTDAGVYTITGTGTNSNYDVSFIDGRYTVNARPTTVTVSDLTSVYGDDAKLVKVEATNLVNNDIPYTVTPALTISMLDWGTAMMLAELAQCLIGIL